MFDKDRERTVVPTTIVDNMPRRRVLSTAAMLGIVGGVGGLVSAQEEATEIELDGETGGWIGVAPAEIGEETNPALILQVGADYAVTWTNTDQMPHNFVIENQDEESIIETEVIEDGSQTVEFIATEEMAAYYCGIHPEMMRGDIQLTGDEEEPLEDEQETEEDTEDEEELPEEDEEEDEDELPAVDLPREYHAHLLGEHHEVETEATGEARFHVAEEGTEADFELTVENICNVTQAHIHLGEEGEDGPVVVWLYPKDGMEPELIDGRFDGTLAEGTFTADDFVGDWENAEFEDALATVEMEAAYVNVHTEEHPGGEIRGQIVPPHE